MSAKRPGEPGGKGSKFGPKSDHGSYMAGRWVKDDDSELQSARAKAKIALKAF